MKDEVLVKKNIKLIWAWDVAFALLFVASLAFLMWKCRIGFANIDENFYLTIPLRILKGDALFAQEWHVSQMSSFLLLPFVYVYMLITGSTTGILLVFRYIYTALMALATLFIYWRLRRKSRPGACVASISFFLYAPFGIMAMSYNSLGIVNLVIALVLLYTAERAVRFQQVVAGLFFAGAVLCCPYLLAVYAAYFITVVVVAIYRGRHPKMTRLYKVFDFRSWLFFSIGALILAVAFALFILANAPLNKVIQCFPYILNDPEHQSAGILASLWGYVQAIVFTNSWTKWVYIVCAALAIWVIIDRKRRERRVLYLAIAAAACAVLAFSFYWNFSYINFYMFPLNVLAFFCYILVRADDVKKLFYYVWIPGMMYSICLNLSSNQEFFAISSASAVALVGSIMIIFISARELVKSFAAGKPEIVNHEFRRRPARNGLRAAVIAVVALISVCQLGIQTFARYKAVFWENPQEIVMDAPQKTGPERGILMSPENEKAYMDFVDVADMISEECPNAKSILVLSEKTYGYLVCENLANASFSAWMSLDGNYTPALDEKLSAYYTVNPQKIPDVVYMDSYVADAVKRFSELGHYMSYRTEQGPVLLAKAGAVRADAVIKDEAAEDNKSDSASKDAAKNGKTGAAAKDDKNDTTAKDSEFAVWEAIVDE